MKTIRDLQQLRSLYEAKGGRSVLKELPKLDPHARQFIALSPFVVLATYGADGRADASPRGGDPGFVKVLDDSRILIPDAPGNNRLDTLENIVAVPDTPAQIGLLFMVPGMDETLRINGLATLTTDETLLVQCQDSRRVPKLAISVQVHASYLHCAKAFMRSELWNPAKQIDRKQMPSMGEMLRDQIADRASPNTPVETQEEMLARYRQTL
jgi:uncharacterized protein